MDYRTVLKWAARAIVAIDLAILLALAANLGNVRIVNNAIDIWFDNADPTLQTLHEERQLFGTDTWMLATVWGKPVAGEDQANAVRRLTRDVEHIPGVSRVISPTSIPVLQRNDEGLFFDRLDTNASWSELRAKLLDHPIAGKFLVYGEAPQRFSLLIKERTGLSTAGTERQHLVSEIRRVLDNDPAVSASAVSGTAVINADLNRLSWGDFTILMPATTIVASLVVFALVRFRVRTTLAILTPVSLATVSVIAAMLLSGRPLTMMTIGLPGLIFTLGIASSLHVTGWMASRVNGRAMDATRQLFRPMLVSQVTTALGFAVLAVVQVTPMQEMALFGAAGVAHSALHVLILLPTCLLRFGAMRELADGRPLFAGSGWAGPRLEALVDSMQRVRRVRHWAALLAATCVALVWMIAQVKFDSTYLNMIDGRERLRRDYARFDEAGLPSAELSILIRRANGKDTVDTWLNGAMREATRQIENLPGVSKVLGPAAVFAEVAPALGTDQTDASVTDAYIFALSGNTDVTSYVRDGLDAWRMVVFFPYVENSRLEQLSQRISGILDAQFRGLPGVTTGVSGVTVLWANMDNTISRGQITSIVFMASICFVSFLVSLRDWRLALSSTFVNVLPVAMVGALLGATGRPIDMATVFIMGIALGIADDDTSFFVHECVQRERQEEGAVATTLRHTGPATVATCLVIVLGFTMLLLSSFTPMRTFGGMTAIGLALAMLCDVFLLPFLFILGRRRSVRQHAAVAVSAGVVLFLVLASPAKAETGREIAQKSQAALFGFQTLTVSGEMTLRRGADVIGQRTIAVEMIEQQSADSYDQARVTITGPSSLKDTRLLTWSRAKGDDQQWLVTPRTGRVQKIAERGRQAAFVSSDFSYEDILKWQVDAYEYTSAGRQKCDAEQCSVVEAKPHNRYSNYSLLKVYFDDLYRIRRIDYYTDRTDKARKTLVQSGYVQVNGTWQPSLSVITDTDRNTSTAINWSGYHLNKTIDARIMTPNAVHP